MYYDISKEYKEFVKKRDGSKCLKCGSTKHLTVDHIVPKSILKKTRNYFLGNNYQTLCFDCNLIKGVNIGTYRKDKLREYSINQFAWKVESGKVPLSGLKDDYIASLKAMMVLCGKSKNIRELKIEHQIYMV